MAKKKTIVETTQSTPVAPPKKVEDAVQSLANVQVAINKQLSDIQATLINQHKESESLAALIVAQESRLSELAEMQDVVLSLEEAKKQHELLLLNNAEEVERLRIEREREEEEYEYKLNQKRKVSNDEYTYKYNRLMEDLKAHEATLTSKKKEYDDLLKLKADLPAILAKSEADIEKRLRVTIEKEHTYANQLNIANLNAQLESWKNQVTSLKAQVLSEEGRTANVRVELSKAHETIKELGAKALEASSGKSALEAVHRTLEQTQTQSGKGSR